MDQIGVADFGASGSDPVIYSPATYPFDDVVYIVAQINPNLSIQGSGAIIGPHSILTASHVVWDHDLGEAATQILAIPAYPAFDTPVGGKYVIHYFQIDNSNNLITASQSQSDFAVIDYAADLSKLGSFGIDTAYQGGTVHMTGYPAVADGFQTDQVGAVTKNIFFNLLDYSSITPTPGNSGGPLWVDEGTPGNPLPYVVGVVSTDAHAVLLTPADLQTIQGWQTADAAQFALDATGSALQAQAGQTDVEGGVGDDTINGWSGGDYLRGNSGDDTMSGGAGADIFHTSQDAGVDRVLDFHLSEGDRVQLDPGTTFTVTQVGADTDINLGAGNLMVLVGVQMSSLTPGWIFGA